jgi:ribonuclease-3
VFNYLYKKIKLYSVKNKEPYLSLYKLLGFYPDKVALYEQALMHKSSLIEWDKSKRYHNERLEFLGDAILDAVIADILYKHFPNCREGYLTNTRSKIVQRENLNRIAIKLGLHKMLVTSIRLNSHNNYVYGNALEALIGAVYLDQGYRRCYQFIYDVIISRQIDLDSIARKEVNFKSSLIEWSQKNKLEIFFDVIDSFIDNEGNPVFQSRVMLLDYQIGIGIGYSKKESQQNAAKVAIKKLRTDKELQRRISDLKRKQNNGVADSGFDDLPDAVIPETEIKKKQ